jgi:L,D-transpeptidase ErfK/SrfK
MRGAGAVALVLAALAFAVVFIAAGGSSHGQEEVYEATVKRYPYNLRDPVNTVVGAPLWHTVRAKQTILDVAREYGLGYNEMESFYPRLDPWLPPVSKTILVPSQWVLPTTRFEELVINVAELRLYFFDRGSATVQTYPIGIGDEGWETPLGSFYINDKRANPAWYIPASLQAKYGMAVMPPGPENPLGEFVMKFSAGPYGIHGTHMPWGVGRLVSHGCIRCYPEHIRLLFPQVRTGAKLEIIYEPVKLGRKNGQVFAEIHSDVYQKIDDFERYAADRLQASGWAHQVDMTRFALAVRMKTGAPINVTNDSVPGVAAAAQAF